MASPTLSSPDRKNLDKFVKFLALKSAQVIVQSRQGVKSSTKCKPLASGVDWFNLEIQDNTQVSEATKKAFNREITFGSQWPLCIDISLKTTEGDEMLLENWCLNLSRDSCDHAVNVLCTVYYRIGILLKSLISVSRITPAYKLSRQQSSDSFTIHYNIYTGEPSLERLGAGFKEVKVGNLATPLGTLSTVLSYRTKMTISPSKVQNGNDSMLMKSDHFHADLISKNGKSDLKNDNEKRAIDLNKPLKAGAFVDVKQIKKLHNSLSQHLPPEPPMLWLLSEKRKFDKKRGFGNGVLNDDSDDETNGDYIDETNDAINGSSKSKPIDIPSRHYTDDPRLMKILDCPFADGSPIMELASFYRECANAPAATSALMEPEADAEGEAGAECTREALAQQLDAFEANVPEFDSVVAAMCSAADP